MYCFICDKKLADCKCEDYEKYLDSEVRLGHLDYKKCQLCKKHEERCKCDEPKWIMASAYIKICKE